MYYANYKLYIRNLHQRPTIENIGYKKLSNSDDQSIAIVALHSVKSFSFRSWKVWTTIVQEEVFVRMLSFPPLWKSRGRCEEIVVGRAAELWRLAKEVEGRHLRLLGLAVRLHDLRLLTSRAHESAVRRAEQNRTAFASASSSSLSFSEASICSNVIQEGALATSQNQKRPHRSPLKHYGLKFTVSLLIIQRNTSILQGGILERKCILSRIQCSFLYWHLRLHFRDWKFDFYDYQYCIELLQFLL